MALLLLGLLCPRTEAFAQDIGIEREFMHWVSRGETLNKIARRYFPLTDAITMQELIDEIREINDLDTSLIRPKQPLLIPLATSGYELAKTVPKARDFMARGIYMNRYSMGCQKMTRLVDNLIGAEGNTVVLDFKDMSGRLSYPSRVHLATEIGANSSPIIRNPYQLFHFLHEKGLHICVRLVAFYDPLLAARRPEFALRSSITHKPCTENGKVAWVDPSLPTVQRYNLDIARELAEMGVDEIQFDYIRYPALEDVIGAAAGNGEIAAPKHEIIAGFLTRAQEELASYKLLLGIDVFGIIAWGRPEDILTIGQKIENLAQHCDVICPMIYPSHFFGRFQGIKNPGDKPFLLVSETCRRFSHFLEGSQVTLRPWIQSFPFGTRNFSESYILEQLRALAASESRGWLLWSASNAYRVAWKALNTWNEAKLDGLTASAEPLVQY
jgi:hypothetical protein